MDKLNTLLLILILLTLAASTASLIVEIRLAKQLSALADKASSTLDRLRTLPLIGQLLQ